MNSYGKTDINNNPWIKGQTSNIYFQQITLWNEFVQEISLRTAS